MRTFRESFAPLALRDYRRVFLATTASYLGDQVVPVALAFAVLEVTGSATALGIVLLARTVPLALFVVTGGVWADRLPRQLIMWTSDGVRFVSQTAFALLLFTDHAALWAMALLQAVHGAASAFYRPAGSGLLAQLLTPELRQRGTALMYSVSSVAGILGPIVAGGILAVASPAWALLLDAFSFAASALLLARVRTPPRESVERPAGFLRDLAEGWSEVVSRPWLRSWIVNFMVFQFAILAAFMVLGPLVAKTSLGGTGAWALMSACVGVGSLAGSVVAIRWHPRRPLAVMGGSLLFAPVVLAGLAVTAPVYLLAGASVVFGVVLSFADAVWETVVQNHVPERVISRVVSYDWLGSTVLRPLGLAAVGPLAATMGTGTVLLSATGVYLAVTVAALAMRVTWTLPSQPVLSEASMPVTARATAPDSAGVGTDHG